MCRPAASRACSKPGCRALCSRGSLGPLLQCETRRHGRACASNTESKRGAERDQLKWSAQRQAMRESNECCCLKAGGLTFGFWSLAGLGLDAGRAGTLAGLSSHNQPALWKRTKGLSPASLSLLCARCRSHLASAELASPIGLSEAAPQRRLMPTMSCAGQSESEAESVPASPRLVT